MSSPTRNILDRYVAVRLANIVLEELHGTEILDMTGQAAKNQAALIEAIENETRGQTTIELLNLICELAIKKQKADDYNNLLGCTSRWEDQKLPFRDDGSRRDA